MGLSPSADAEGGGCTPAASIRRRSLPACPANVWYSDALVHGVARGARRRDSLSRVCFSRQSQCDTRRDSFAAADTPFWRRSAFAAIQCEWSDKAHQEVAYSQTVLTSAPPVLQPRAMRSHQILRCVSAAPVAPEKLSQRAHPKPSAPPPRNPPPAQQHAEHDRPQPLGTRGCVLADHP